MGLTIKTAENTKGSFTCQENNSRTRIILESEQNVAFGLHDDFSRSDYANGRHERRFVEI